MSFITHVVREELSGVIHLIDLKTSLRIYEEILKRGIREKYQMQQKYGFVNKICCNYDLGIV